MNKLLQKLSRFFRGKKVIKYKEFILEYDEDGLIPQCIIKIRKINNGFLIGKTFFSTIEDVKKQVLDRVENIETPNHEYYRDK